MYLYGARPVALGAVVASRGTLKGPWERAPITQETVVDAVSEAGNGEIYIMRNHICKI